MTTIVDQISKVESEINQVEQQIREVELKLAGGDLSQIDTTYYRNKEQQLRIDKQQLREEKLLILKQNSLHDEKKPDTEEEWETIIHHLPPTYLSLTPGTVVEGWRRENGATTRPRLFLRPHIMEKKEEIDKFLQSDNRTRLYVDGPPGAGKTSFFLLYCAHRAMSHHQRALIVQYRQSSSCEIMIVDNKSIKRLSLKNADEELNENNLLEVLQRKVLRTDIEFDFFIFDGVRQKIPCCTSVLSTLNTQFGKGKGIHITSLQFRIHLGDGTFETDEFLDIYSWEFSDYQAAYDSKLFDKKHWQSILEDNESELKRKEDTIGGKDDDEEMKDNEDDDQSGTGDADVNVALLERKFYYAGGSARFMLAIPLGRLVRYIFPKFLKKMTKVLWEEFAGLTIGSSSESTVNSLMQVLVSTDTKKIRKSVTLPVSKYILHKAHDKCRKELVNSVKAAAVLTCNPALQGWAFELDQIEFINGAIEQEDCSVQNGSGTLEIPIHSPIVTYDGDSLSGATDAACFVIKCIKWNQGCFDIAVLHHRKLVTIQFTVSRNHSAKLHFVRYLKEALEERGKEVDEIVHHVAIVENDSVADKFKFDKPEESSGTKAFKVALAKSTKLCRNIRLKDAQDENMLNTRLGTPLSTVICPKQRSIKRQRNEVSYHTYS